MQAFPKGCNVVVLDPEMAQVFPDSESVNQALRALAGIIVRKDPSLADLKEALAEALAHERGSAATCL